MIAGDQPTIFGDALVVGLSSVSDGNLRFGRGDDVQTLRNRIAFFETLDLDPAQATLVQVTYDGVTNFTRYETIDETYQSEGILAPYSDLVADGLVVVRPGHTLFLPLADCIGAIIYDTENQILMMSHLGRHSLEVDGATKSIQYIQDQFGAEPANLQVWLSPAVGAASYPLHDFDGRSLHAVATEQLVRAGVELSRIEVSSVDTASDDQYFSHSQFAAGRRETDGRFGIIAMMRE